MTIAPDPEKVRRPLAVEPPRMEALATLPLFFALAGQRVVVAGGGPGAAWKAELLAAAGARVEIHAPDPSPELAALVARGAAAGTLVIVDGAWTPDALKGCALALCDAHTDGEGEAFACAARAAGVPVNVIDKPQFCDFTFGTIVNRSPVVVGISTSTAAPILGQAIRRRVEAVLPPSLAGWAQLATDVRQRVMARLAFGAPRRAFWEGFADRALSGSPAALVDDLIAAAEGSAAGGPGRVTLVGAGPGGAEHLTLKAVRALQSCDVILFDDLVTPDVLELARREAARIGVGKRGGRSSCRQDEVIDLMIALATAGKSVVRLKSGDPMVFGRAGEEIDAVRAAGLEVSVVAGITAASAMAAELTTSLTHRDHAQAVTFVTGHSRYGSLPDTVSLVEVIGKGRTAVVYMGGRTTLDMVAGLTGAGVPESLPAVAMRAIGRREQAVWHGTLGSLQDAVRTLGLDEPILIGLGDVFGGQRDDAAATAGAAGQSKKAASSAAR